MIPKNHSRGSQPPKCGETFLPLLRLASWPYSFRGVEWATAVSTSAKRPHQPPGFHQRHAAGSQPNPITSHAYTSQRENMEIGLYYYNGRYYAPTLARFISADTLVPDPQNSQSLNRYAYGANSPVRYSDPTGHCGADVITESWSFVDDFTGETINVSLENRDEAAYSACVALRDQLEDLYSIQIKGKWLLLEMGWLQLALQDMANGFGGADNFAAIFQGTTVKRYDRSGNSETSIPFNVIKMENGSFSRGKDFARWMIIHEFGHRLDLITGLTASIALQNFTGSKTSGFGCGLPGGDLFGHCQWDPGGETVSNYALRENRREDWSEAFAASMFGGDWTNLVNNNSHGIRADALTVAADRINFVNEQISLLLEAIDAAPTWGEP